MINNLYNRRNYYNWSCRKVAEMAGISHTDYNKIEKGVFAPNVYTALAIANALNTTVEHLWGEKDE